MTSRYQGRMAVLVLLLVVFGVSCSSGDGPTVVRVLSVSLNQTTLTLRPGESVNLVASITTSDGQASKSGFSVTWTSSDPSVLSVTPGAPGEALVEALAVGTATVTVSIDGVSASFQGTVSRPDIQLLINNFLVGPIELIYETLTDGATAGDGVPVNASSTVTVTMTLPDLLAMEWRLVRPDINGREFGEAMAASFEVIESPEGGVVADIDAAIGSTRYFAPVISNETTSSILIGVNMGLSAENRCNCVLNAGASQAWAGYYQLFTNSNVRGYQIGTGYSGPYIYWDNFFSLVDPTSGRLALRATTAPVGPATVEEGIATASVPPAFAGIAPSSWVRAQEIVNQP